MKVELLTHTPEPDKVIASAARLCYSNKADIQTIMSGFTQESIEKFVQDLADVGHESPFEHVSFTFGIEGVSRTTSHEAVRHRIASYSQRSQRYCGEEKFSYTIPKTIQDNADLLKKYTDKIEELKSLYSEMVENGIPKEDARYILPNATHTRFIMTMNARSLMNFFHLRCCNRAQNEIREMANQMLKLCKEVAPAIFKNAGASCVSLGYCPEGSRCCGRAKTLSEILEVAKKSR